MRILLTRPREEALRTAEILVARNHNALLSPVLDIVPLAAHWPQGVVDAVIATSAQAFNFEPFPPEDFLPEARRLMPLFVVGDKTAKAARQRGFAGAIKLAPNAADLTASVVNRMHPPACLVYLAGRDRKSGLEAQCKDAGLDLVTAEVYEARAAARLSEAALAAIGKGEIDAVLHYSRRSTEIFLSLAATAGVDVLPLRHIAISADAALPLQEAGAQSVTLAAEANEQAILAVLDKAAAGSTA